MVAPRCAAPVAVRPSARARVVPTSITRVERPRAGAADAYAIARRLGLTGALAACPPPPPSGNAFYDALGTASAVLTLAGWDVPRTITALGWFEDYIRATERVAFVPASGASALSGALYNRETLDRFGVFIRQAAPKGRTKGERVSADAVAGYQSAIYVLRCREAGYDVAPAFANQHGKGHGKQWLQQDGAKGEREVGRGFRALHFARLATRLPVVTTADAVERAAGLAAHNLLLRGGEVGERDTEKASAPRRLITWLSLEWRSPSGDSGGRPWLLVHVVPIKDIHGRARAHPIPVARSHDGPFGSCATDAYDAVAVAWWARRGPLRQPFLVDRVGRPLDGWWRTPPGPSAPAPSSAFFSRPDGAPMRTTDVRRMGQRWAVAIDEPPEEFKARMFRVAGATDLREVLGLEGREVIKARGRWDSDIHSIYERPLLREQLRASALAGSASGAGLEDVISGFAQPARR